MPTHSITVPEILDLLERHHGKQTPWWPTDPYEFLIWWHCGYPQSDDRCVKGWAALTSQVGTSPRTLLAAKPAELASALKSGGMVPELRAMRLKEIAMRVQDELGGDLDAALREANAVGCTPSVVGQKRSSKLHRPTANSQRPTASARKILKSFPNIGDPGADRILLFAGMEPVGAVPSNNVHVLVRVLEGRERENYGVNYRASRQAIEAAVPPRFDARQRVYLLLKVHGNALCKAKNPKCDECPLRADCAYAAGKLRGRAKAAEVPGSRR